MTLTINADGTVTVSGFPGKRAEPAAVEQSASIMQTELVRLHGIAHEVHRVAADALGIEVDGKMADAVSTLARAYRKARVQVAESHAERVSYADLHRGISDAIGLAAPTDAQLVEAVRDFVAAAERHEEELGDWSAKCNRMDMAAHEQARTIDMLRALPRALCVALCVPDVTTDAAVVEMVRRLAQWKRDAHIAAQASASAPQGGYAAGRAGALAEAATFRRRVCDALGLGFGAGDDVVVERAEGLAERARVTP